MVVPVLRSLRCVRCALYGRDDDGYRHVERPKSRTTRRRSGDISTLLLLLTLLLPHTTQAEFLHESDITWKVNQAEVARWKTLIGGIEGGQIEQPDVQFGTWELAPGAIYHGHVHEAPEIYYILSGKARWTVGEETREVGPGMAVYTPPGAMHRMENLSDEPVSAIWLWWAPEGKREVFSGEYRFTEEAPPLPNGKGFPDGEVEKIFD